MTKAIILGGLVSVLDGKITVEGAAIYGCRSDEGAETVLDFSAFVRPRADIGGD